MIYVILAYITYPVIYLLSRIVKHDKGSVLVFQTAKIGDMICTTPVFREVKKADPGRRLGVVVDPVTVPLLRHNPHIDEIIVFDRKRHRGLLGKLSFAYGIYKKRYSTALILMPNITNVVVPLWALIPERVSVYPDSAGRTLKYILSLNTGLEYHVPPRMSMETYMQSLKFLGILRWSLDKEVYPSPQAESRVLDFIRDEGVRVGLVLGTGNALKDWGKENFSRLAGLIIKGTGATVFLLGSGKESVEGEEIRGQAGERIVNLCGLFTLEEGPALIKKFSLVVGVDTGLIYMADALGVPVIDIAGPCDMADQRPTGKKSHIIQDRDLECVPCSHTFSAPYECTYMHKRCVTSITAEDVFKIILKIINAG